jgi:hypothetical protein
MDSAEMSTVVKAELDGLFHRDTFKIVVMPDTSDHNVLRGNLCTASNTKMREKFTRPVLFSVVIATSARIISHTASSLSHSNVRVLLAIAAIFGWDVWTKDGMQAHLQSVRILRRALCTCERIVAD